MTSSNATTGRLPRPVVAAVVAVAGVIAVGVADPVHHDVPLCPFHALTGWQCPLCGGLRATYELGRLHLGAALRDNVLVVAAVPLLLAYWLVWLRRDRQGLPERRMSRTVLFGLWAVAAVFLVVRNLPGLDWLRPPA